jgi:uncharacterized membrane protein YhhN
MTATAGVLLAATLVSAAIDWTAVWFRDQRRRYLFKPLTLLLLIGVALTLDPADPSVRTQFVIALALSLAGDILLMVPGDQFVLGLGAFLLAHVAYAAGLVLAGVGLIGLAVGLVVVIVAALLVGVRIVAGARDTEPVLVSPVVAYMVVISVMVVCAFGTGIGVAIAGALLFYLSDALIGWGRFVRAHPRGDLAVMVTYHLGQVLLVLSLV